MMTRKNPYFHVFLSKKIIIRMLHEDLTDKIIAAAYEVRKRLTPGYLESIYEKALIIELTEQGLNVESQVPIQVDYKGINIGDFKIDLLVEDKIIVEIKAINHLQIAHELQLVNYLTIAHKDVGLLINFGADKLEIKRKHRIYTPTK